MKPAGASYLRAVTNSSAIEVRVPIDMGECDVRIGRGNLLGAGDKVDAIVREVIISNCDGVDRGLSAVLNKRNFSVATDLPIQGIVARRERHYDWIWAARYIRLPPWNNIRDRGHRFPSQWLATCKCGQHQTDRPSTRLGRIGTRQRISTTTVGCNGKDLKIHNTGSIKRPPRISHTIPIWVVHTAGAAVTSCIDLLALIVTSVSGVAVAITVDYPRLEESS